MPELEVFVTNKTDTIRRRLFNYWDAEVTHPLNDSRLASVKCPIDDSRSEGDSAVQHAILPYQRWLKVIVKHVLDFETILSHLIFWGPLLEPLLDFKENTMELHAHDPSIYWKKHHFREDDTAVELVQPVNGAGLLMLTSAAQEGAGEGGGTGIIDWDIDEYAPLRDHPRQKVGMNVYDAVREFSDAIDGPDWELVPIDRYHEDHVGTFWTEGRNVVFNNYEHLGADRRDRIFHYGWGRMNLENFVYEPDGAVTANRFIRSADKQMGEAEDAASIDDLGLLENWEASESAGGVEALEALAGGLLDAYKRPPKRFTMTPTWESGLIGSTAATPWRYPVDITVGDVVKAVAKRGRLLVEEEGRIRQITYKQQNAGENVRAEFEVVPGGWTPGDGGGGGGGGEL